MGLGATLVLAALAWLWLVYTQIPDTGTEWPGPRGFPALLGVVLAILGVLVVVERARPVTGTEPQAEPPRDGSIAVVTFVLLVVYAFLLDKAGFLVSSAVLIVAAMAGVLRLRRWAFIAGFAAAFSLGCWVVFNTLLGIPLPPGVWVPW